ncbi:MAG: radical SAM protein [Planctomycetes bacterium]|nr:radical SAM protein [Planctomycetota bacterium]
MHVDENACANETASGSDLAVWEYAGLLLTYRCSARCAFCYVYSGPERGGCLPISDALTVWRGLEQLATDHGKLMRIHLAGGEPFLDWPHLASLVRAARNAGLSSVEKIETNGFWATSDGLTRARLELLDALNVGQLIISTDVYHQEFVPLERVRRCVEIARRVLGRGRVRVRWWEALHAPLAVPDLSPNERELAYRAALARHRDRLTGRAAEWLAHLLPCHPAEEFRGQQCVREVLQSRHVHIDPYSNVFPGVCNGIILGNVRERGVADLWHDLSRHWRKHVVVNAVATGGSYGLMCLAQRLGYRARPDGYASKCHLCSHVRQFLVDHGHWPDYVGPRDCYANEADQRAAARAKT